MAGDCTGECREDSLLFARLNRSWTKKKPSQHFCLRGAFSSTRRSVCRRANHGLVSWLNSLSVCPAPGRGPPGGGVGFLSDRKKRGDVAEGARFLVRSLQAAVSPHPPEKRCCRLKAGRVWAFSLLWTPLLNIFFPIDSDLLWIFFSSFPWWTLK